MAGLLEAETIVKNFLRSTGMDTIRFSQLSGVSQTTVNRAINDLATFSNDQAKSCLDIVAKLNSLIAAAEPLPLSLRDVQLLKKLLSAHESGALKIVVSIDAGTF